MIGLIVEFGVTFLVCVPIGLFLGYYRAWYIGDRAVLYNSTLIFTGIGAYHATSYFQGEMIVSIVAGVYFALKVLVVVVLLDVSIFFGRLLWNWRNKKQSNLEYKVKIVGNKFVN